MQSHLALSALVVSQPGPMRSPRHIFACRQSAGPSCHAVQDRPEHLAARCLSPVSLVQHSEPLLFDGQIIGVRRPLVIEKTTVTFP